MKSSLTRAWARAHPEVRDRIQLADGSFALVDPEDFERVIEHSWHPGPRGVPMASVGTGTVLLRRFIYNAGAGVVINSNEDLLDCRRANLREASSSRRVGCRKNPAGTSRYKGVSKATFCPRKNPWRAQITNDGKMRFLGYFPDQESAARAYDVAAAASWGARARLNFPEKISA